MSEMSRDYYSTDETLLLLRNLSDADYLKLMKLAKYQSNKVLDMDSDDLLNEGIRRVLDGTRQWPRGLDITRFMYQTFGSIVSAHAKHRETAVDLGYFTEQDVISDCEVGSSLSDNTQNSQSNVSSLVYAEKMMSRVIEALSSDPNAQVVALSIAEGLSAKEAQARFSISTKQYDAARKRLRRVTDSLSTEEVQK